MKKQAKPGSVSHDTFREEDLIPAFMFLLEKLDPEEATRLTTAYSGEGWPYSMAGLGFGDPFDEVQQHLAPDLLEELTDALDACAPPGHYFGPHVGNSSDFGFWPEEVFEEELR